MTKVVVRFAGTLRWVSEKDQTEMDISEPATVRRLIESLILKMDRMKSIIDIGTSLDSRPDMIILVNETEIGLLEGLQTPLSEGDLVTLIPTAHGG